MMSYKGYTAEVELDLTVGVLVGRVLDIDDVVMFESERADEIYKEFTGSVDEYLAVCAEQGKEPNRPHAGTFVVRATAGAAQPHRLRGTRVRPEHEHLD